MSNNIEKLVEQFILACNWNSWETITQLVQEIVSGEGKKAIPILLRVAEDSLKKLPTRKMALEMIAMIRDEGAIPGLQTMLKEKKVVKRRTLRGTEGRSQKDLDKLDDEEYIQDEVVVTLREIQGQSSELDELISKRVRITRRTLGMEEPPSSPIEIGEFKEYNTSWHDIEPGDAIHRYMGGFGGPLGHAGIYIGCKKGENQEDCKNHKIIEMSPKCCVVNNLYNFCHLSDDTKPDSFWGFRKHRRVDDSSREIIFEKGKEMAKKQAKYSFFAGYKSPEIPTFRCDGFVEWCYEQAVAEGIVADNNWMEITPASQACSPKFSRVIDCPFDRRCFSKGVSKRVWR